MEQPDQQSLAVAREQIDLYQSDHLLVHDILDFDPVAALARHREPATVFAVDLGGDRIRASRYQVQNTNLRVEQEDTRQALDGAGYLAFLEELALATRMESRRVGISAAARLDGSVVLRTPNLPVFQQEFAGSYHADFNQLFGDNSIVVNDTAAGIVGASMRLAIRGDSSRQLLFVICGSGLGASIIHDGRVHHVEAAHVPLVEQLNPLGQTTHCHVDGRNFVCLERVTAMRSGVELLHRQLTGDHLDAAKIGERADASDPLATALFDHSANALSHAIAGMLERFDLAADSTVVLHGGAFERAAYRVQVERCLRRFENAIGVDLEYSRNLSPNVCLDGAAVLAASGIPQQG